MSASILTIGNELVSGDVTNTNASWLARRLAPLGVDVHLMAALPDEIDTIAEFVRAEAPRVDFLLVTGGLGGTPDDLTHQFKANYSYELPMGEGHFIHKNGWNRLLGGWMTSGNVTWVSGNPLSIYSGFGTFLREGDSGTNEANTNLSKSQIDDLLQFRMTPTGPYFVAASALGPDGRGAASPGQAPFSGQVFFNPGPGQLGTLQRRDFTGPNVFNMDAALSKETKFNERVSAERL